MDQGLGPDEHVETVEQVSLECLPRRVGHLQPGDVVGLVAQTAQHLGIERVPGRGRELVHVERKRRAGVGGREQVGTLRGSVELEVRRPDHRHRVGPRAGRVLGERHGVRRGLGAAVRGDEQPAAGRLDEELRHASPSDA